MDVLNIEDAPPDEDLALADGNTTGGCFNIDEGWLGFLFAAVAGGALPLPNTYGCAGCCDA